MSVCAEAGQAHAAAHRHHVGPQYEGRLGDVVDEEAGLRGHQHDFGLLLGAHHGQVPLPAVVLGGRWRKVDQLTPPRPVGVLGGVGVAPNLVGALDERSHAVQEAEAQHRALQHQDRAWECSSQQAGRGMS